MEEPLVSICIPAYNGQAYLSSCLESALLQTYPNIEILLIDDGSTDDTLSLAFTLAKKNNQVRILQHPGQTGMVANWNNCINQAKGEWIKFLFQDDLLDKFCVDKMLKACVRNNCQITICARNIIIENSAGETAREFFMNKAIHPEVIFTGKEFFNQHEVIERVKPHLLDNILGEPTSLFFNRNFAIETGLFIADMKQLVDYEFALRLILQYGFSFIAEKLVSFRVHGSSVSNLKNKEPVKTISPESFDKIILLCNYLYNHKFESLRNSAGGEYLLYYLQYMYGNACKKYGAKRIRKEITKFAESFPILNKLEYSFVDYQLKKYKVRAMTRKMQAYAVK